MAKFDLGGWTISMPGQAPMALKSVTLPTFKASNGISAPMITLAPAVVKKLQDDADAKSLKEAKRLAAKARRDAKGPPPIRAFEVLEDEERTGGIFFARHNITARKKGANEHADGEIGYVSCRRVPWADGYADTGLVPAGLCVQHGWHFECHCCGRTIDSDHLHDRGKRAVNVVGFQEGAVFCDGRCAQRHRARERMRKRRKRAAIRWLRDTVRKRFGRVKFVTGSFKEHVYVTDTWMGRGRPTHWQVEQASVSFEFPGQKIGPASLDYRINDWRVRIGPHQPEYRCCNGDREAFMAWAEATRTPACMADEVRA